MSKRRLTAIATIALLASSALGQGFVPFGGRPQAPDPMRQITRENSRARQAWLVFDADGSHLRERLSAGGDWLAAASVAARPPFEAPAAPWLLELVDGQRLPGEPGEVEDGVLVWLAPRLGEFRFELREVAAIRRAGASEGSNEPAGVRLANGDRLESEPEIGERGVVVESELGRLTLPWDRVAEARLRSSSFDHDGLTVWLRSGAAIFVESVEEISGGRGLRVRLGGGRLGAYHADEVLAVTRGGARIAPLGPPDETTGRLDPLASGAMFRAPATARWTLDGRAIGIVGAAMLPESARRWGAARTSIWAGTALIASVSTDRDRPRSAVGAGLERGAGVLVVSVQPGATGVSNGVQELRLAVVLAP